VKGLPHQGAPLGAQSDYWFPTSRTGLRSYITVFWDPSAGRAEKGKSCLLSDQAVSDNTLSELNQRWLPRRRIPGASARREGATRSENHSPSEFAPPLTRIKHSPRCRPEHCQAWNARSGSVTRILELESCYTSRKIGEGGS